MSKVMSFKQIASEKRAIPWYDAWCKKSISEKTFTYFYDPLSAEYWELMYVSILYSFVSALFCLFLLWPFKVIRRWFFKENWYMFSLWYVHMYNVDFIIYANQMFSWYVVFQNKENRISILWIVSKKWM